jgi:hypothetical protein
MGGMGWETGIGGAASRHTDQTDFESNKYNVEKGKAGRWEIVEERERDSAIATRE